MKRKTTLLVDACINMVLGVLLLAFSPELVCFLGMPASSTRFYPNILGAVFIGITLALVVEAFRESGSEKVGLGLIGAICINMCGGVVLAIWLLFGDLAIPLRGQVLLWGLVVVLLVVSLIELIFNLQAGSHNEGKKE